MFTSLCALGINNPSDSLGPCSPGLSPRSHWIFAWRLIPDLSAVYVHASESLCRIWPQDTGIEEAAPFPQSPCPSPLFLPKGEPLFVICTVFIHSLSPSNTTYTHTHTQHRVLINETHYCSREKLSCHKS